MAHELAGVAVKMSDGILPFLTSNQTDAGEPLTRESFERGMALLKERDAWERTHPHGLDPENPHIVSSRTRERLLREGGYGFCGTCGPFWQPPPEGQR